MLTATTTNQVKRLCWLSIEGSNFYAALKYLKSYCSLNSCACCHYCSQYMIVMIIIVILEVIAGLLAFAFWPEVGKESFK